MKKLTATPRVYIASLSDYNNGSLLGEWFDLTDYNSADEVLEAIHNMLKGYDTEQGTAENMGQAREEWAARDFENLPQGLYSEMFDFAAYYEYAEALDRMDEAEIEAFTDYCENLGECMNAGQLDGFRDAYNGHHDSEESFADQLAEGLGYFACGMSAHYFDTAAFARDLFCGDYWMSGNGHVFRNK